MSAAPAEPPGRGEPSLNAVEDEVIPEIALRALRWTLPDDLAAELEPGRVLKACVVFRCDEVREDRDGKRWHLLEVGRVHD